MAFRAPLGDSDFISIRSQNAAYVDKTAAVAEIATTATKVMLFTRPRRFGKSTLLSTLEAYFQHPSLAEVDTTALFADLAVWRSEEARVHHRRYPVLALSFKDTGARTWKGTLEALRDQLAEAARRLGIAGGDGVSPLLRERILFMCQPERDESSLRDGLRLLCEALRELTEQPVVLLIDEYDSPLHAAWQHGYLDEALSFFRALFGSGLKENRHLHKAVITGILRVARESLFSGVNHLQVWSLLDDGYAEAFGFTEAEVAGLAESAGLTDRLPSIEAWYNGYVVGGVRLYNPWSVLMYLDRPAQGPQPYWSNTGGTALAESLLAQFGTKVWADIERLLAGGAVSSVLSESLVFSDLTRRVDAVWSLLLAAGYLKPQALRMVDGEVSADLAVPNREVLLSWRQMAARALRDVLHSPDAVNLLTQAMLAGDEVRFGHQLRELARDALSYHDLAGEWPERVWQAFVLGILVHMDAGWEVRSNLETGYGRADVIVRPRQAGRPGALLELKRIDEGQDVEAALEGALRQIAEREYASGLRGVAEPLWQIAVVFEGKRPYVRFRR